MESIKQVEIEAIRNKKKVTRKDGKEKNQDYLSYTYLMSESVDIWTQSHDIRVLQWCIERCIEPSYCCNGWVHLVQTC